MPKKRRSCKSDPDTFCCICGQLTLLKYLRNLTDKIKRLYYAYCGCAVGDQDKASNRSWTNGSRTIASSVSFD